MLPRLAHSYQSTVLWYKKVNFFRLFSERICEMCKVTINPLNFSITTKKTAG